jgi:hydrogenase nickel incorporation protein HypA/HybF
MHEYPVTLEIIRLAEESCKAQNGLKVEEITLVAGESCGYLPESIELYFDIIAAGSLCEDAKLSIIRVPPRLKCADCGGLFLRKPFSFICPDCGGNGEPTDIGREFYIESFKIRRNENWQT